MNSSIGAVTGPDTADPSPTTTVIIDALGGPKSIVDYLATATGETITTQAVSGWRQRGIPHRYRGHLVALADDRRVRGVLPDDFIPGVSLPSIPVAE